MSTFASLEKDGWDRNAARYEDIVLRWTSQAFEPILDTFSDLSGVRGLDVASGTGHLVRAAADRGALAEGLDVAPSMVRVAREKFSGLTFVEADAEAMPHADASFGAVTCCFGLLHMERPDAVLAEVFRVLKPGGRFTYSTWQGPSSGGAALGLILSTYQQHANMDVGLPPAPPMFQLADPLTRDRMLAAAGFAHIQGRDVECVLELPRAEAIEQLVREGLVRTRLLFERQSPDTQQRILQALIAGARKFDSGSGGVRLPNAAHIVTAIKP
jgi:SAM-dependent methyltransferase